MERLFGSCLSAANYPSSESVQYAAKESPDEPVQFAAKESPDEPVQYAAKESPDKFDYFGKKQYKLTSGRTLCAPPGYELPQHTVNAVSNNGLKMMFTTCNPAGGEHQHSCRYRRKSFVRQPAVDRKA